MTSAPTEKDVRAALDWFAAMGADLGIAESPVAWLDRSLAPAARPVERTTAADTPLRQRPPAGPPTAAAEPPPAPARDCTAPASRPVLPRGGEEAVMAARDRAGAAATLLDLEAALAAFEGCGLKATAKNLCFYRGAAQSRLMLIGEAPGRDEDLQGKPFVGRAGQLLDRMLASIGLKEPDVHITNIVYWRPPGNRTPTPQEALVCKPFLERQIELVAPEFILLLGGAAAKQVLDTADGIMKLRGKWRTYPSAGRTLKVLATLHPAYLLRNPAAKRMAWRDLLLLRDALDAKG